MSVHHTSSGFQRTQHACICVTDMSAACVQEAAPYKQDPEVLAMTNLVAAYQANDILGFEKILRTNRRGRTAWQAHAPCCCMRCAWQSAASVFTACTSSCGRPLKRARHCSRHCDQTCIPCMHQHRRAQHISHALSD